jgi:hypothetical protein
MFSSFSFLTKLLLVVKSRRTVTAAQLRRCRFLAEGPEVKTEGLILDHIWSSD